MQGEFADFELAHGIGSRLKVNDDHGGEVGSRAVMITGPIQEEGGADLPTSLSILMRKP
ncbi:MAG: hypothetical protein RIS79_832 [Verrucomicrobiota bacterium]|jgi:hypothetical protein